MKRIQMIAALFLLSLAVGCVGTRRELTIESEPAGAIVYLNGDEVGRTPMKRDFLYYGTVDVKLRKEGYELLEDSARVWAPWWQVPPIDLVAEAFSLTDRHRLSYELRPKQLDADPQELIQRGSQLREKLESSEVPKKEVSKK